MSWVCVLVSFFSFCSELYRFLLGFFCLGGFFFGGGEGGGEGGRGGGDERMGLQSISCSVNFYQNCLLNC